MLLSMKTLKMGKRRRTSFKVTRPPYYVDEGGEEEADEGQEEVDGKEGWRAGDLCVAPWEEEQDGDGCWYHAQVIQHYILQESRTERVNASKTPRLTLSKGRQHT